MKTYLYALVGLFILASVLTMYVAKDKTMALIIVVVVGMLFLARVFMVLNR